MLDGSFNGLIKKYSHKVINIKYKGKISDFPLGMEVLEKSTNELKILIDESKIKLTESISFLSSTLEVLDIEIKNTDIDDVVANLYKEYQI